MNSPNAISLENLTVGYERKTVLRDINLDLTKGRLVCFMGPNGAGKSTLIKTICQFMPPESGRILIENKDISAWSKQELSRKISVVLTDKLNAGQLTGREIVASGRYPYTDWSGRLRTEDKKAIETALDISATRELGDTPFYEMSDGQRQKIMIARALCQETPIIILDEPTAHLDLNNRVAIVSLLRDLAHEENRAILMATHELDLALQMADELWLAESGKGILRGIPEDLVLNGLIDRVFQFKGYDLKTGNVHPKRTGRTVNLEGEGFLYLWTKNALERNGYELENDSGVHIRIREETPPAWQFGGHSFLMIQELLEQLNTFFSEIDQK